MSYYEYRAPNIDVSKELACFMRCYGSVKCLLVLCVCVWILV